jgi:hypothetical protein
VTTPLDRADPCPGYWPSGWPVECGGNRRQKARVSANYRYHLVANPPGGVEEGGHDPSVPDHQPASPP